ncbi:MAG: GNAT family N-acetyltransferase [Caulobacteraceae bacterium]
MDSNGQTCRNAVLEDISSIMKIEHSSFSHAICEEEKVFVERIITFSDGFRVMEFNGEIVGYICSEVWDKGNAASEEYFTLGHSIKSQHKPNGSKLYISSMGILPEYRGKGFGKLLFNEFIKYITAAFVNIDSVILIVSEKWINARKIYKENKFKEIHVLQDFFKYKGEKLRCEDGIVMRRSIHRI